MENCGKYITGERCRKLQTYRTCCSFFRPQAASSSGVSRSISQSSRVTWPRAISSFSRPPCLFCMENHESTIRLGEGGGGA
jgi:hypothetical protein